MKYALLFIFFAVFLSPTQAFACSCFLVDRTIEEEILAMDNIVAMKVISIKNIDQKQYTPGYPYRIAVAKNIKNLKGQNPKTLNLIVDGGPCGFDLEVGEFFINEINYSSTENAYKMGATCISDFLGKHYNLESIKINHSQYLKRKNIAASILLMITLLLSGLYVWKNTRNKG